MKRLRCRRCPALGPDTELAIAGRVVIQVADGEQKGVQPLPGLSSGALLMTLVAMS